MESTKPASAPRVESTGMKSGEVYVQGGKLLSSDGTTVSDGDRSFTCSDLCWFYDEPAVLVTITIRGEALFLVVFDAVDGREITSVADPVGFHLTGSTLTGQTRAGVKTTDLTATRPAITRRAVSAQGPDP